MKNLLSIVTMIFALNANAYESRNLQIPVSGHFSTSYAEAQISYLQSCADVLSELSKTKLAQVLSKAECSVGSPIEKIGNVKVEGAVLVKLQRVMGIDTQLLSTGYADTLEQAKLIADLQCDQWKSSVPERRKNRIVFESCGKQKLDTFYEKPAIESTAVRIEKIRTAYRRNEFCKCSSREVLHVGHSTHRITVYDLMVLVDDGYFEKNGTFDSYEECTNAANKNPACVDD